VPTRLKVLISAYACEPGKASEPSVGWNVALEMTAHHNVWVLTRSNNRASIEAELAQRPVPNLNFAYFDLPSWASWWKRGGRGLQVYYYLWQLGIFNVARHLHREVGFDVTNHLTFGKYWTPSLLAYLPVPFVWGPMGGGESAPKAFWRDFSRSGRRYELLRDAARWLGEHDPLVRGTARRAAVAIASTPATAARLVLLGARNVQVYLQNGIRRDDPGADESLGESFRGHPEHGLRFITIGRLIHWKGVHLGLRAFALADLAAEYWIVGDGPERARLEQLAESLGISDRVRFFGSIPHEETLSRLSQADVLVHPSLHDQAPATIFEAFAAGRPVICLGLGGPAVQVSDEVGIRVAAQSPEEAERGLAAAMRELAQNESRRGAMAARARPYVYENFSWDEKVKVLSAFYLTAANPAADPATRPTAR